MADNEKETAGGGDTMGAALGEAVALLMASPKHRVLFLSDLEWVLLPALMLRQFRLFRREGRPVGLALWGYLDAEAEARLSEAGKIRPGDWKSGDNLWLVELVCPAGGDGAMLANLKKTAFAGAAFRYHVTDEKGGRRVVRDEGVGGG